MKIRKTTLMCLATVCGLANLAYSQDWSEQDEAQIVQSFDAGTTATKPTTPPKPQAATTMAATTAPSTGGQTTATATPASQAAAQPSAAAPAATAPNTAVATTAPTTNVVEERYGDTTATSANYKAPAPAATTAQTLPATVAPIPAAPASMPQSAAATTSTPTQSDIIDTTASPSANKMIAMGAQKQVNPSANEQTFSIDFPTGDIKEIIRSVADLYSLNVVIPEALIGSTSIKLSDVTWPQVFTAILQPVGYGYMEDGNIIKIKSKEEIANEPMDTRLFPLQYTTASVAAETVKPMLGEGASTFADDRTNTVVIIERPSKFKNLEMVLKRLDKEEPQIQIQARFLDIKNTDSSQMGVNFAGILGGKSVSAQNLGRSYARTKNQGPGSKKEVTTNYVEGIKTSDNSGSVAPAIFSISDLSLILGFLKTNNDSKLISNPSVVTMNNVEANISVLNRQPVPQYSYNQDQGVFEISGFDYIDIGIKLKVLPKAKQDLITMSVKPELSDPGGEVKFKAGGAGEVTIPIVNTRTADTNVTIKDGYTIAIGGLMQRDYKNIENKVPGLGNIPGIGRLFRYNDKNDQNRSLLVLLTANQIGYGGEAKQAFDKSTPRNIDAATLYRFSKSGMGQRELNPNSVSDEEVRQMTEIQKIRDASALQDSQAKLKLEMEAMTQAINKEKMDQQTIMSKQKRAQKIQKMRSK
jgi:type IV pilus assembly protein PilQ